MPIKLAAEIFRDYEVDGVSSSGLHKPIKADIRDWAALLESLAAVGVSRRVTVKAATAADVVIGSALNDGDTVDGVTVADGDLVLVKDQVDEAQNGIYVVGASPARDAAFDAFDDHSGLLVAVQEGNANASTFWLCAVDAGGTIDVMPLLFTKVLLSVQQVLDALGIHAITVSTEDPTGGQDGDLWFKVPA
jgi:hypothetical protein